MPIAELESLFARLVSDGEKRRRNYHAKLLRGSELDDQLETGRLQHRQGRRFLTIQNRTDVGPLAHSMSAFGQKQT